MPTFAITGSELELPRNLALLDTNILIALADPDYPHHPDIKTWLDYQEDYILGVPPPVIVEACNFITGKLKRPDRADFLLRWLLTPGNAVRILPAPHDVAESAVQTYLGADVEWMAQHRLDYVDAFLMQMANRITDACQFRPDLVIVTMDLGDFLRCLKKGYAFRIYDPVSDGLLSNDH